MTGTKGTRRHERGFTLGEMLIVVGILGILLAIGFIGLVRWQTNLKQIEYDATAKEIYMAAQNHLTYAESQGSIEAVVNAGYTPDPKGTSAGEGSGATPAGGGAGEPAGGAAGGASGGATSSKAEVYYYVYTPGTATSSVNNPGNRKSLLSLMLPFGSIDETVRQYGYYIIRYQPDTATVIDVFFSASSDAWQDGATAFAKLKDLGGADHAKDRQKVDIGVDGRNVVVGHYPDDGDGTGARIKLKAPTIKVNNGDVLSVEITNPKSNVDRAGENLKLQLIVEGLPNGPAHWDTSLWGTTKKNPKASISLTSYTPVTNAAGDDVYTVVLDDVTRTGSSFYKLATLKSLAAADFEGESFVPGSDIKIHAEVSGKDILATVAKSVEVTTNSIFGDKPTSAAGGGSDEVAYISSFRHLANLSGDVSCFLLNGYPTLYTAKDSATAVQTTDLSWETFTGNIKKIHNVSSTSKISVYNGESGAPLATNDTFPPVFGNYKLSYSAAHTKEAAYRIAGIEIVTDGPAGVFAELVSGSSIKNLEVVNASINSQKDRATGGSGVLSSASSAGGVVGKLNSNTTLENVLVRTTLTASAISGKKITSGTGVAGGLVGTMAGGKVENCAAAVLVEGKTTAGGLVGSASDSAGVTYSYSGGHTEQCNYKTDNPDVKSDGTAGGLIGSAASATIQHCYSTCSAQGATVGGLAGSASGATVNDCYVTGLIAGSGIAGAFIGSLTGTNSLSENHYYEIENPIDPDASDTTSTGSSTNNSVTEYMKPVGSNPDDTTSATPFDAQQTADTTLSTFASIAKGVASAIPYDKTLAVNYNGKYAFKAIAEFTDYVAPDAEDKSSFTAHLIRHYGDWPMPETLFINSGTAPSTSA